MKRNIFFILGTLAFSSVNLQAQEGYTLRQLTEVIGQLEWSKVAVTGKSGIEGTPYLWDDFKNGEVFYDGKFQIPNVALRLNLFNDEFEYKVKDAVMVFADPAHIDKIVIDNEVFVYVKKAPDQDVYGYVKKWNAESPSVLTKMKIEFKKREEVKAFAESKPDRFERAMDRHFIMKSDNEITRITSVKKLIKYLGNHESELSGYAKKEKISTGDPEELKQLLDYYQTLQ